MKEIKTIPLCIKKDSYDIIIDRIEARDQKELKETNYPRRGFLLGWGFNMGYGKDF